MNIVKLAGRLENGRVVATESYEKIASRITAGDLVIVQNCFNQDKILAIRKRIHQFGLDTPEGNPPRDAKTIDFHRIDDNHPKMSVKRIAHFYRFSYANKGSSGVFEVMEPMNYFRNAIAGLDSEYSFYEEIDGFLSQPAVLHYPAGGGYLQAHIDPVQPQFVEMVLLASQKGIDFKEGGLLIQSGSHWIDAEAEANLGDLVLFRPDIPHKVGTIDPHIPLDWKSEKGRWIVFSPIANIRSEVKNEKALADAPMSSYS